MSAPSILVVDDGELDRVQALLERVHADWVRCADPDLEGPLERPRDLLVTSGPRAMRMPPLAGEGAPLWVCIYDQDFLPLRERLRDLGVHYLVSGDVAPRTFLCFLRQLLYRNDRRRVRRIPIHCDVSVHAASGPLKGRLVELSRDSCVFACEERIALERDVTLDLPQELCGDAGFELRGRVVRSHSGGGDPRVTTVLRLGGLEGDAAARVQQLLSGGALGTQVTPLLDEAGPEAPGQDLEEIAARTRDDWRDDHGDRRQVARRAYDRAVEVLRWSGDEPPVVFGRDLSLEGLRIAASPPPPVGTRLDLALYGRSREEPVLLEARVVRVDGSEAGLRFGTLGPGKRRDLQNLIETAPPVEAIGADGGPIQLVELVGS